MNNKMKLKAIPVRKQITDMQGMISEIKKDLSSNEEASVDLREENKALEEKTDEKASEITKMIFDDLASLQLELVKVEKNDAKEIDFLKQQIKSLEKDKTKLVSSIETIESRLNKCENMFGIGVDQGF